MLQTFSNWSWDVTSSLKPYVQMWLSWEFADLQSRLFNAIVCERQSWSNSVSDTQEVKSPLPGNGQMGNDPEIKRSSSVYKEKQPCRREDFLSCQASRSIGFVTTEMQRTNHKTSLGSAYWASRIQFWRGSNRPGKKAGNKTASSNTLCLFSCYDRRMGNHKPTLNSSQAMTLHLICLGLWWHHRVFHSTHQTFVSRYQKCLSS